MHYIKSAVLPEFKHWDVIVGTHMDNRTLSSCLGDPGSSILCHVKPACKPFVVAFLSFLIVYHKPCVPKK